MGGYQMSVQADDQVIRVSVGESVADGHVRIGIGPDVPEEYCNDSQEVTISVEEFAHLIVRMAEFVKWAGGQEEYMVVGREAQAAPEASPGGSAEKKAGK